MSNDPRKPSQPSTTGRDQAGPTDPQSRNPIQVPGRPDADNNPDRDQAYGPGGGKPSAAGRDAAPAEPDQGAQDPNQPARTGRGADTKPM